MNENNEPPSKKTKYEDVEKEIIEKIEEEMKHIQEEKIEEKSDVINLEETVDKQLEEEMKQQMDEMKRMIELQKMNALNKKNQKTSTTPKPEEKSSKFYEKQIRAYSLKDNHKMGRELVRFCKELLLDGTSLKGKIENITTNIIFQDTKYERIASVDCSICKNCILWCPHVVALIYKFNLDRKDVIEFSKIQSEIQSLENSTLSKAVLGIIKKKPEFLSLLREEIEIVKSGDKDIIEDFESLPFATTFKSKENYIDLSAFTTKIESIIRSLNNVNECDSEDCECDCHEERSERCRTCRGEDYRRGDNQKRLLSILKISYNISRYGDHYNGFLISLTLLRDYMALLIEKNLPINLQMIKAIVETLQKISLGANFDRDTKEEFGQFISELESLEYVQDDDGLKEYMGLLQNSLDSGWDSPALLAVLNGETKEYKESKLVAEIRIKKLKDEERYQELLNYTLAVERHFNACEAFLFLERFSEAIDYASNNLADIDSALNLMQLFISFDTKVQKEDKEKAYLYCVLVLSKKPMEHLAKNLIFIMIDLVSNLDQKYLETLELYVKTNFSSSSQIEIIRVLFNKEIHIPAKNLVHYLIEKGVTVPYELFKQYVDFSLNEKETLIPFIKKYIKDTKYIIGITNILPEILGYLFIVTLKSTHTIKQEYFPKDNFEEFFKDLEGYVLEPFSKIYSNQYAKNYYLLFQLVKSHQEKSVKIVQHFLKQFTKVLFPFPSYFEIIHTPKCTCSDCERIKNNLKDPKQISFTVNIDSSYITNSQDHITNIERIKGIKRIQFKDEEKVVRINSYNTKKTFIYTISKTILPSDVELFQNHFREIEEMTKFILNYQDEGAFKDMSHISLSLYLLKHLIEKNDPSAIVYYTQAESLYQRMITEHATLSNSSVISYQFNLFLQDLTKLKTLSFGLYQNLDDTSKDQFIQKFENNISDLSLTLQYAIQNPRLKSHLFKLFLSRLNNVTIDNELVKYLLIDGNDTFIFGYITEQFKSKDLRNIEFLFNLLEKFSYHQDTYIYLLKLFSETYPKDATTLSCDCAECKKFYQFLAKKDENILKLTSKSIDHFTALSNVFAIQTQVVKNKSKGDYDYVFTKTKEVEMPVLKNYKSVTLKITQKILNADPKALISLENPMIQLELFKDILLKKDKSLFPHVIQYMEKIKTVQKMTSKGVKCPVTVEDIKQTIKEITNEFQNILSWIYNEDVDSYKGCVKSLIQNANQDLIVSKLLKEHPDIELQRDLFTKLMSKIDKKSIPSKSFLIHDEDLEWYYSKIMESFKFQDNGTIYHQMHLDNGYNLFKILQNKKDSHTVIHFIYSIFEKKILPNPEFVIQEKPSCKCDLCVNEITPFLQSPTSYHFTLPQNKYHSELNSVPFTDLRVIDQVIISKRFFAHEILELFETFAKQLREMTLWLYNSNKYAKEDFNGTSNIICLSEVINCKLNEKNTEDLEKLTQALQNMFNKISGDEKYQNLVPGLKEYLNSTNSYIKKLADRVNIATQPEEKTFEIYYNTFKTSYSPQEYLTLKENFKSSSKWETLFKKKIFEDIAGNYSNSQQPTFKAQDKHPLTLIQNHMEISLLETNSIIFQKLLGCLLHDQRQDTRTGSLIIHAYKLFQKYRLDINYLNQIATPILQNKCQTMNGVILYQITDFLSSIVPNLAIDTLKLRINFYKTVNVADVQVTLRKLVQYYLKTNRLADWKIYFVSVITFFASSNLGSFAIQLRGDVMLSNPKPIEVIELL